MAAGLVIPQGSLVPGLPDVIRKFDSNDTAVQFDLVNIQSGKIKVAAASQLIAGYLNQKTAITNASTNCEVNITPFLTVIMDSDASGTAISATTIGQSYNITGGTAAQIVATSTAVTSVSIAAPTVPLRLIKNNPQNVRDDLNTTTTVGKYMVISQQFGTI